MTPEPRADVTPTGTSLSALDTTLTGGTPESAIADSIALARRAEALGFSRYWFAEHHGRTAGAGSAPIVTSTAIADATTSIRVGSGGIMIPNHVPLIVAEQFGTLAALHPGRIDLGVGRAAPPDAGIAAILGHYLRDYGVDDFADRVDQLVGFLTGAFPSGRDLENLHVAPRALHPPVVWVLGTSQNAAAVAAALGLPFAFAHHFGRGDAAAAFDHYRANFRPSMTLAQPHTLVTILTAVASTTEEASTRAGAADLYFHHFFQTHRAALELPSIDDVRTHVWTDAERTFAATRRAGQAIGDPSQVAESIDTLLRHTAADELMVTTQLPDLDSRIESLELVSGILPRTPASI